MPLTALKELVPTQAAGVRLQLPKEPECWAWLHLFTKQALSKALC